MNKVLLSHQALLGAWFCVIENMPEDDALDEIITILKDGKTILECPVSNKELVRDRLFGGFKCKEYSSRRHIYFALGHYTFLNPEKNTHLSKKSRLRMWDTLVENNPGNYIGGSLFTKDFKDKK